MSIYEPNVSDCNRAACYEQALSDTISLVP